MWASGVIRVIIKYELGGRDMRHVWETEEVLSGFWWGNLRERDNLKELVLHGTLIIKWNFKKWDGDVWTELIGSG